MELAALLAGPAEAVAGAERDLRTAESKSRSSRKQPDRMS